MKTNKTRAVIAALAVLLVLSLAANVCFLIWGDFYTSYLQDTDEIYVMESGILSKGRDYADGEDVIFSYDFDVGTRDTLIDQYGIDATAGEGGEFERAVRLMHEYAPRLRHASNYDNHIEMNASALLEYSLDRPEHGINCRAKAQILNEMLLSLGIYSRKIWLNPYSKYDTDCHVVNEVWDTALGKWVMLDITNDEYWIDGDGTPLSALEIRSMGGLGLFCTPVKPGESTDEPEKLRRRHDGDFIYIMKNMAYTEYLERYSTGENSTIWLLLPENIPSDYEHIVSLKSVERPPFDSIG